MPQGIRQAGAGGATARVAGEVRAGAARVRASRRPRRRTVPVAMVLLALAGGGCAEVGGGWLGGAGGGDAGAAQAGMAVPADPVVAFAAQARPGTEGTVTDPATGQAMRVRLVRAYAAASGRECRELALMGFAAAGGGERRRLVCRGEGGAWAEARPLLRSGLVAMPGGSAFP